MERFAEAEELYREALQIGLTVLGENHPDVALVRSNLASLCVVTGHPLDALPLMMQATAAEQTMLVDLCSIGSEADVMVYRKQIGATDDALLSLVAKYLTDSAEAIRAAFTLVLRRKALGLDLQMARRRAALQSQNKDLLAMLAKADVLGMKISRATLTGPRSGTLNAHVRQLEQWKSQKEELEAELAHKLPPVNLAQELGRVDVESVSKALPKNAALVEFVRFDEFDFFARQAPLESRWLPPRYLAFVLCADEVDKINMIDIGGVDSIDRQIGSFRTAITGRQRGREIEAMQQSLSANTDANLHGKRLRESILDKILGAVGKRQRILLATDGGLTCLPFQVLPSASGGTLIDVYEISYLSCGRDVLRSGASTNRDVTSSLIVADPDFDLQNVGAAGTVTQEPSQVPKLRFERLPGTRIEGQRIAEMLGDAEIWLDRKALKVPLKKKRSPYVLHLATHGLLLRRPTEQLYDRGLPEFNPPNLLTAATIGPLVELAKRDMFAQAGVLLDDPLSRSGLALSGVNTWLADGDLDPDADDGLLTAVDVSSLDLLGTEMVVLSACETGLGEARSGEGVFGLRRAFVLAGARSLIMSLWRVPDFETQDLMVDFYRRVLAGTERSEALRQAQLAMKAKYPDPFYWGAFICEGEPGPLSSISGP